VLLARIDRRDDSKSVLGAGGVVEAEVVAVAPEEELLVKCSGARTVRGVRESRAQDARFYR
jgi:hypothetical protein